LLGGIDERARKFPIAKVNVNLTTHTLLIRALTTSQQSFHRPSRSVKQKSEMNNIDAVLLLVKAIENTNHHYYHARGNKKKYQELGSSLY